MIESRGNFGIKARSDSSIVRALDLDAEGSGYNLQGCSHAFDIGGPKLPKSF